MYALMNEQKTYGLWREMIDGSPTLGISSADYFPKDIGIEVIVGEDAQGNYITKPLTDGFLLTKDYSEKLMCRVTGSEIADEVTLIRDTGNLDMGLGLVYSFDLDKGVNRLRILHTKNNHYVNFYRYDLIFEELTPILSANPNPVDIEDKVSFTIDFNQSSPAIDVSAYTYRWDFGNGVNHTTEGVASNTYIYADAGTYTVSVDIYNQTNNIIGNGVATVKVVDPLASPEITVPPNNELVGTWVYESETAIYSINFAVLYTVSTFVLNSDGTCSYTFEPVILREPTDSIEDAERINLLDTYPTRYPGMTVPEHMSGQGTYTYMGKGQYLGENQVGVATMVLTTPSSQYDYYNFIEIIGEKLIFKGTEFTKK